MSTAVDAAESRVLQRRWNHSLAAAKERERVMQAFVRDYLVVETMVHMRRDERLVHTYSYSRVSVVELDRQAFAALVKADTCATLRQWHDEDAWRAIFDDSSRWRLYGLGVCHYPNVERMRLSMHWGGGLFQLERLL